MNKFIRNIDKVYSIILSILTIAMDKHWILFMVLLLLNVLDTLTGWIKSRINNKENSMAGLKGIAKKVAQWILVLLSFIIPVCFEELGKIIHIDLAIFDYSLVIAPVVADLCTTPVALSAPPNSYQNNSQS